jgi:hypothetical protein
MTGSNQVEPTNIYVLRRVMALAPDEREELLGHLCSEAPEAVQEVLDLWWPR